MKAKTRKIVSLVLAAAMTITSLTFVNVASVSAATATYTIADSEAFPAAEKGTVAKGTVLFNDSNVKVEAIRELTRGENENTNVVTNSAKDSFKFTDAAGQIVSGTDFRPSIGITPAVAGTVTLKNITFKDGSKGTNYAYVFTCTPEIAAAGGEVTVTKRIESPLAGQDVSFDAEAGTTYYLASRGATIYFSAIELTGDAVTEVGGSQPAPGPTPGPTPAPTGTVAFRSVVDNSSIEVDGTTKVNFVIDASEDAPVNNATFFVTFNKDELEVVGAELIPAESTDGKVSAIDVSTLALDAADKDVQADFPDDLLPTNATGTTLENGVVKFAFYLAEGVELKAADSVVASLTFKGKAAGKDSVKIANIVDANSKPDGTVGQVDYAKEGKVDTSKASAEVEVKEKDTPPAPTGDNVIDGNDVTITADGEATVVFTLDNKDAINNGTFWIEYNAAKIKATKLETIGKAGKIGEENLKVQDNINMLLTSANLANGDKEHYEHNGAIAADGTSTPATVGALKTAFYINGNGDDEIDSTDVIPAGSTGTVVAKVTFKVVDNSADFTEDVKIDVVDFAGVPDVTGTVGDYKDINVVATPGTVKYTKGVTPPDTSTTEATTTTTTAAQPDNSTTTTEKQPDNTTTTEQQPETTTQGSSSSNGSGGGGGGSSHGRHTTTTEAAPEATTEAPAEGETNATAPDNNTGKPSFMETDGYHFAYMVGYPDGTFGPNKNITRGEIAAVFARLMTGEINVFNSGSTYTDVNGAEWFADYVEYLASSSVISGYTDGSFGPEKAITRAEFATILSKYTDATGSATFSDTANHWAAANISKAVAAGWMSGYPDGTFKPDAYVTRAEVVSAINRATGRTPDTTAIDGSSFTDVAAGAWYANDVEEAATEHWYTGSEVWYLSEDEYKAATAEEETTAEEVSEETTEETTEGASEETTEEAAETTTEAKA